jgi:ribosomal protein L35
MKRRANENDLSITGLFLEFTARKKKGKILTKKAFVFHNQTKKNAQPSHTLRGSVVLKGASTKPTCDCKQETMEITKRKSYVICTRIRAFICIA